MNLYKEKFKKEYSEFRKELSKLRELKSSPQTYCTFFEQNILFSKIWFSRMEMPFSMKIWHHKLLK